jgi:16S rRNA (adenine(1408)-N(1))-methyltransferase
VTITRVIGKGRTARLDPVAFGELRAQHTTTAVDVGTGDGRFAYHLASADRARLVIGIDSLDEPMGEIAAKAARKSAKGGRANLLLVRAAIEALPAELEGVADEVSVQLPWGSLLEGIVLAREDVLGGLAALCRPGARVMVTLNGEIWLDSTPARYERLPVPTPEYVADVVAAGMAHVGIRLDAARYSSAAEAKELATTWARRLGHGRPHPSFVQFEGIRSPGSA